MNSNPQLATQRAVNVPDRLPDLPADLNSNGGPHGGVSEAHWRELIGQIGSDIGLPLTSALERVTAFAATGKIDRAGLKALREEIERARRVGMMGQQLARYASGRIRQSPEQTSLTQMLRDVLVQRGREVTSRGIEIRQSMQPAEVIIDATLLHALIQAVVDWAFEQATQTIEMRVDFRRWPANARLICRFPHAPEAHQPLDVVARHDPSEALDSMSWRLVQQLAWTLKLGIERLDSFENTTLTLEFPHTLTDQLEGVTAIELDHGFSASDNSKPLAGSHVLVVAARRDLRADIREATRHMGLLVDFVNSVEEAEEFCRDALPHAIVFESALAGQRLNRLRDGILEEVPGFVFIEIAEEGDAFELSDEDSKRHALVGRSAVSESLPSALIFELSRTM